MLMPLVKEPDPILHQKAAQVADITKEIQQLIDSMIETMYAADGVGLAANQIGSSWDILIASPNGHKEKEVVLINAVILERQGRACSAEGCLSLPGVSADVSRSSEVTVTGLNRKGEKVTIETEGLLAKILQHEVDHLNGHLFVDRLGLWQRRRILAKYKTLADTLRKVQV